MGIAGAIDDPTFVVMATATVIGALGCPMRAVGLADETSTMRAVLLRLASGGVSTFGGGLCP